ncbi:MAG: hypothetical protein ACLFV5_07535 [Anaerolineales bacterium]
MIIIVVIIVALLVLSALDRDRWPQSKGRTKRNPGAKRLPPQRRMRRSPSVLGFQGAREDSSSGRWWWE